MFQCVEALYRPLDYYFKNIFNDWLFLTSITEIWHYHLNSVTLILWVILSIQGCSIWEKPCPVLIQTKENIVVLEVPNDAKLNRVEDAGVQPQ